MNTKYVWAFTFVALVVLVLAAFYSILIKRSPGEALSPKPPPVSETAEEKEMSGGESKTRLVELKYFWSVYCVWCKKEEPILREVVAEHPTLILRRIDVNDGESSLEVEKYKVSGTPTFVLLDGTSTKIAVGFLDKEQLISFVCQKLVDEGCKNVQPQPSGTEEKPPEGGEPIVVPGGGFC